MLDRRTLTVGELLDAKCPVKRCSTNPLRLCHFLTTTSFVALRACLEDYLLRSTLMAIRSSTKSRNLRTTRPLLPLMTIERRIRPVVPWARRQVTRTRRHRSDVQRTRPLTVLTALVCEQSLVDDDFDDAMMPTEQGHAAAPGRTASSLPPGTSEQAAPQHPRAAAGGPSVKSAASALQQPKRRITAPKMKVAAASAAPARTKNSAPAGGALSAAQGDLSSAGEDDEEEDGDDSNDDEFQQEEAATDDAQFGKRGTRWTQTEDCILIKLAPDHVNSPQRLWESLPEKMKAERTLVAMRDRLKVANVCSQSKPLTGGSVQVLGLRSKPPPRAVPRQDRQAAPAADGTGGGAGAGAGAGAGSGSGDSAPAKPARPHSNAGAPWSASELTLLMELHQTHGNDFATIGNLLGRSEKGAKRKFQVDCSQGSWCVC